jgi:hypothetical protein
MLLVSIAVCLVIGALLWAAVRRVRSEDKSLTSLDRQKSVISAILKAYHVPTAQ